MISIEGVDIHSFVELPGVNEERKIKGDLRSENGREVHPTGNEYNVMVTLTTTRREERDVIDDDDDDDVT